jgi:hypothetical protein
MHGPGLGPCSTLVRYVGLCYSTFCKKGFSCVQASGRGSAWLERLVRDQEVGGSNPLAPTTFENQRLTAPEEVKERLGQNQEVDGS